MNNTFLEIKNAAAAPLASVPLVSFAEFRDAVKQAVQEHSMRVASFFAMPEENGDHRMTVVLCGDNTDLLYLLSFRAGRRYPALTADMPQFHWFEREIAEQYGIVPENHPWLKPIRFHRTLDNAPDEEHLRAKQDKKLKKLRRFKDMRLPYCYSTNAFRRFVHTGISFLSALVSLNVLITTALFLIP